MKELGFNTNYGINNALLEVILNIKSKTMVVSPLESEESEISS